MYRKDDVHQSYSVNEDYANRLRQALARGFFINTAYCRLEDQYVTVHDCEGLIEPLRALTGANSRVDRLFKILPWLQGILLCRDSHQGRVD